MSDRLQQPTQEDIVALAAAMLAEARGEGEEGMTAVGHVLANRARVAEISIPQVAYAQAQITGLTPGDDNRIVAQNAASRNTGEWQAATQLAQSILNGSTPDITRGSTYYYAPDVMRAMSGSPDPY